jgi:hypothetical protein
MLFLKSSGVELYRWVLGGTRKFSPSVTSNTTLSPSSYTAKRRRSKSPGRKSVSPGGW